MSEDIRTTLKRYESTAKYWREKANREYAYAKNDKGGQHYHYAKVAYEKASKFEQKAENLRATINVPSNISKKNQEDQIVSSSPISDITMLLQSSMLESGAKALYSSIRRGDDFKQTVNNCAIGITKETASSTASALVGETVSVLLNVAPIPSFAKGVITTGAMMITGNKVSKSVENNIRKNKR